MPAYLHKLNQRELAFTLLELSIVLVVVGLLAAGILVGSDLIQAARIRAQISQIESYTTAVNTFRIKYDGLPGDLTADQADAYGFTERSGAVRNGDGNGVLASCAIGPLASSDYKFGCETALFWSDLSQAQLIEGNFTSAIDDYMNITANNRDTLLPRAKMEENNYLLAFGEITNGKCADSFCLAMAANPTALITGTYTVTSGTTPLQAYSIDSKIDDGKPNSGVVLSGSTILAAAGLSLYYAADISSSRCDVLGGNDYQLAPPNATRKECIMNFLYR